jgi:predicted amidohydrolase
VVGVQSEIVWEDPAANFARLEPRLAEAAALGARLVVLPEMFACGFSMAAARVAEPPGGPSASFLHGAAARHGLWLCGSLPELPPEAPRPFNTLVLAAPDGRLWRYRKRHPFSYAGEHLHYGAGDELLTVDVEGLRCTFFICYDLRFADAFWGAARQTDAYVVVANWPARRRAHWRALLPARAIENLAYVVGVNRVGQGDGLDYAGDSCVIDPWGETLAAAAGQETLLLAELDPRVVREARETFPVLNDRRG